ncbi:MAG: ParA family protein [Acidimicrobiales bacterium]
MVLNHKGGVLKTAICAHLAGISAASGWKVLAVDLDPQGNLGRDLGYMTDSDGGAALLAALRDSEELRPLEGVRPGLDVIAGGPATAEVASYLTAQAMAGRVGPAARSLERTLSPLAGRYDLVVMDCPPGEALIHTAAMTAAHHVLIPTQPDDASIDGLGRVFGQFLEVRSSTNPHVQILGVVLGPIPAGASAIERRARAKLAELLGPDVPVFDTTVRLAQQAAVDCRERGLLAAEYEAEAEAAGPWIRVRKGPRYSRAASGLAGDYTALAKEVIGAVAAAPAVTEVG